MRIDSSRRLNQRDSPGSTRPMEDSACRWDSALGSAALRGVSARIMRVQRVERSCAVLVGGGWGWLGGVGTTGGGRARGCTMRAQCEHLNDQPMHSSTHSTPAPVHTWTQTANAAPSQRASPPLAPHCSLLPAEGRAAPRSPQTPRRLPGL